MNCNRDSRAIGWLGVFVLILSLAVPASAAWKEKVLYSFQGGTSDGSVPAGGVVFDKQGNLYGATTDGGMVYQLAPPAKQGGPWTETVLYVFQGNTSGDGATPFGGLVIDSAGDLYGTTAYGGTGNCVLLGTPVGCGTVYELSPPKVKGGPWTETVLYSFPTPKQGYFPWGDLVFDSTGNLYGATMFGGGRGTTCNPYYKYCGAVFELSPPKTKGGKWAEKVLYGFKGGTDGAAPNGGLVFDSKGAIYGTTFGGGVYGWGTVFEMSPAAGGRWKLKVLHTFPANNGEPSAGVVFDASGNLYGTTVFGGAFGYGTVFEMTPKADGRWVEKVLYSFNGNGRDGYEPGGLIFDTSGNLYGTTYVGGVHKFGTVFEITP